MFGVEPSTHAGQLALEVYAGILSGVRADVLVEAAVRRAGDVLFVQDNAYDLTHYDRVFVCGAGKASALMASTLAGVLGSRFSGGLIVTHENSTGALTGFDVVAGSHPVPDERSLAAGELMLDFGASTTPRDLVLFCLSGGASALMEALKDGIELSDLRSTTESLLKAGDDIQTLNAVRTRLSRVKGGGLARAFKAKVVVLVISDVIGGNLSVVGSGPFLAPKLTHRAHAVAFGFEGKLSPAVRAAITDAVELPTPPVDHFVIGSASLIWPLAAESARKRGLTPVGYADPMKGEARMMAGKIMKLAKAKRARGEAGFCMVLVGETTVKVRGEGKGGRCQEMAVRAVTDVASEPDMAFLAAGSDGIDGPTDAAGGLDERGSSRNSGLSIRSTLAQNDAYHFLESCGGLIKTGPTGSNVNDVCLVVHAPD